ncbi:MAG TPA: SDR family NAD(P)-dependent oxidoreductase, partial [Rhodanobacteraceae bacterium]|nr:SDR family NAD(P)-dependent oxidoreductase [Rhodanobacteraceae bacterium]
MTAKTLLVTGASSGFGAAIAAHFAKNDWRVIACARRAERLQELADRFGGHVHIAAFDIRDEAAMRAMLDSLPDDFREIDLLVNNAGLALGTEPAQHCDLAQWKQMIDTNITALVTLTRLLLPKLIEWRGAIVNI